MTDSPSPIDSSFDASDVATPCTVIAARTRKTIRDRENESESEEEEDSREDVEQQERAPNNYLEDFTKTDFSEDDSVVPSVVPTIMKPATFAKTITKVYCFIDEQEFPYMVEVHVPPDCVTLQDVKRKLARANFKYYCIALDPESGLEVKAEVRDDSRRLYPLKNGRFELYLLTVEGSVHSDASSGRRSKKTSSKGSGSGSIRLTDYQRAAYQFDNTGITTDSESQVSLPTYVKKAVAYNRKQGVPQPPPPSIYDRLPHLKPGGSSRNHHHHQKHRPPPNHYEESTFDITEDSEDHYRDGETYYDEDDDDNKSISTDLTSVSQQYQKKKWREQQKEAQRRNKWRTQPSMSTTSSSFSSLTESSMGLEVITVRLNLESMPLGMVPSGHTNARGDAGLYVGDIHDRGAVALDGRIDIGDMIVGINEHSLSNYSNRDAVELLKRAVQRQFLTLTIAKTGEQRAIRNTRQEVSRPLDPNEWMKHANAVKAMPSISEEHSSSTPIPDEWPSNSSASGTPFGGPHPTLHVLSIQTDKKYVVEIMAAPGSGLDIKDREWLKIPIPMSFLGQDLVDWLLDHVKGFKNRKEACSFAGEMLKLGYIEHVVDKTKFSEKCYYVMGEECADYTQLRAPDGGYKYPPSGTSATTTTSEKDNNNIFPASMYPPRLQNQNPRGSVVLPSGGYASMPASPFPPPIPPRIHGDSGRTRDDQRSQTSGSSKSSSRRYVELPIKKTSSVGSGSVTDSISENRVASRSSFRAAMNGSHRNFSIDG